MMRKMHNVNKIYEKAAIRIGCSLVVALLLFGVTTGLAGKWFAAFTRPVNHIAYLALFFSLLWMFLAFFGRRLFQLTMDKQLIGGAFLGYAASVVSLLMTSIFSFSDGGDRFSNSIENFGIGALLTVYLSRALILGGWFFGLISVLLFKVCAISNRGTSRFW